MKLAPFYSSPRARFFDSNGNPLSNGRVSFYYPSTTTLKQIYSGSDGLTPVSNPQILDSEGYVEDGGVWLGEGNYKVVLEASDGSGGYTNEWSIDDIPSANPDGSGISSTFVNTIDDLRAIVDGSVSIAYVMGYYESQDGGGGYFVWDKDSTASDDGGSVIAPSGIPTTGRWIRSFGDNVTAWQFGAMSNATSVVDSNLTFMMFFASNNKRKKVLIQSDSYEISSVMFLTGDVSLEIQEGAKFIGTGSVTIDCTSLKVNGQKSLIGGTVDLKIIPTNPIDSFADWWGTYWVVKSAGNYQSKLLFNGSYTVVPTESTSHLTWEIFDGSVINFASSVYTTSIERYIADENANDIFDADYTVLQITDQREISINHFADALVDSTSYSVILNIVTLGATKNGVINWAGKKVYNSVPLFGVPTTNFSITSKVLVGSLWKFNNSCWVGYILNGSGDYIIDVTSPAFPIANNGTIYAQWLGAGYNVDNDNQNILEVANSWGAGVVPVSGDGSTFVFATDFEFYNSDVLYTYNFIDMGFAFLYVSGAGTNGSVYFRNNTILKNITIKSQNITDLAELSFGKESDFLLNRIPIIKMDNVTLVIPNGGFISQYCYLSVKGSYLEFRNALSYLGVGDYLNTTIISKTLITGEGSIPITQFSNYQAPTKITNCDITGALEVYVGIDFSIKDSRIRADDSAITIGFVNFTTPKTNIIIVGNTFDYTGANTDSIKGVIAYKGNGNVGCVVKDNIHNGFLYSGTSATLRKSLTFNNATADVYFDNDWVILPYLSYGVSNRALPVNATVTILMTDPLPTTFIPDVITAGQVEVVDSSTPLLEGYFKVIIQDIKNRSGGAFSCFVTMSVSVNDYDTKFLP